MKLRCNKNEKPKEIDQSDFYNDGELVSQVNKTVR